jgi:acetyl/propionyl-CoA carboxylase alpha subunit
VIRKVLIANRGEIAIRVIQTARVLGIRTVAVYSEADEHQKHVMMADEAVFIGPAPAHESYLNMGAILRACKESGADAVHPGYGFLSERAEFSEACANEGLTFIGPSSDAMRRLGAKIDAKRLAVSVGVPITPGFFEPGASEDELMEAALRIGMPVMLKASAGGGGRGMRIVRDAADLREELRIASDEALKGFGDGAMMVEKLIERSRHIEVQFLADSFGQVAPLFERECSLQRRHQKLVEETPSLLFADPTFAGLWPQMREATIALVQAAEYTGAGTAEFMLDEQSGTFYFLEVNARLQVEHTVTEEVTGLDLVAWQFRIAQGERLELPEDLMAGERSSICGCAIEARIVAENPAKGFLPSAGRILGWSEPKMPGIRIDTGYDANTEVPRHYDSLLAKVIAHGATRAEALARLREALFEFHILGVETNIAYLLDVLDHELVKAGKLDTGLVSRVFGEWQPDPSLPPELADILAASPAQIASRNGGGAPQSAWELADRFRITGDQAPTRAESASNTPA